MKRIITIALILLTGLATGYGQDWVPYVPGQEYYFQVYDPSTQDSFILKDVFHTKLQRSNYSVYYRHKGSGSCDPAGIQGEPISFGGLQADSLVVKDDYVIYFGLGDSFVFHHKASLGSSWKIPAYHNYYLDFDTIEIRVDQVYVDTVLGIVDSCKKFTLRAFSDTGIVAHPINQYAIVTSKTLGLIRDVGIFHALQPNSEVHYDQASWPYYDGRIVGFQSDTHSVGFNLPPIDSFFNYQAGTILVWEERLTYEFPPQPDDIYIYRDSIASVNHNPPFLSYNYYREKTKLGSGHVTYQGPLSEKINLDKYRFLREGPSEYISIDTVTTGSAFSLTWYNRTIRRDNNSCCIEAVSHGYYLNQNCDLGSMPDIERLRKICSGIGWVKEHFYNFGDHDFTLIGYMGVEDTFGNTKPLNIGSPMKEIGFKIRPNPTISAVSFGLSERILQEGILKVHDLTGRTVLQKHLHGKATWSVDHLQPGLYLLTVSTESERYQTKLMVQ